MTSFWRTPRGQTALVFNYASVSRVAVCLGEECKFICLLG